MTASMQARLAEMPLDEDCHHRFELVDRDDAHDLRECGDCGGHLAARRTVAA